MPSSAIRMLSTDLGESSRRKFSIDPALLCLLPADAWIAGPHLGTSEKGMDVPLLCRCSGSTGSLGKLKGLLAGSIVRFRLQL